jgi:hypothetical protein
VHGMAWHALPMGSGRVRDGMGCEAMGDTIRSSVQLEGRRAGAGAAAAGWPAPYASTRKPIGVHE